MAPPRIPLALFAALVALASCAEAPPPSPTVLLPPPVASGSAAPALSRYPAPPRGAQVDDVFGMKVADPYRPLEELDAPATRAWVKAENELTDRALEALPERATFRDRVAALTRVEKSSAPMVRGGQLFWLYDPGDIDQPLLVTAAATAIGDARRTVLDPNALSQGGKLSLAGYVPSEDGTRLAYGMATGGGDWQVWRVRDLATGQDFPDELSSIKYYPPQLTGDGKALYYARFPAPPAGRELAETDHDCKVYLHVLGTPSSSDRVVYERPDHPTWQFLPVLSEDGQYLVIETGDGQVGDRGKEQVVVLSTKNLSAPPVMLAEGFDAEVRFLGNEGPLFFVQTNLAAPRKRVVAIDVRSPERARWKEIVAATANAIDHASLVGQKLLVTYVQDAHSAVVAYDTSGKKLRDVALPGLGQVYGFGGRRAARTTYFSFESFTTPRTAYRYDLESGAVTPWRPARLAYDPEAFETTQAFYPAKDGAKIPIFLASKKGLARDGRTPTLLTGYGSFGTSMLPRWRPSMLAWMEHGGILATANLRGGGEYGEDWHRAAMGVNKQVTWDDFVAAAEWLARERYTSKAHLGIFGGSGGGLLVGVAETQRPDLFGAVAPLVGVHDMLRFHLFGQGAGWSGDFGSPAVPAEARALLAYSPLHNVRAGTAYPPTYIVTSDHDVRVAPLHSYKLAAALQAAQGGPAPVLLRVRTSAGHGGATTKTASVENDAELLAFFARWLEGPPP